KFEVPASKQRRQLPVAVAEIEDDREWVVLLRMRRQKVDQEALSGAGCAKDECVADVLDVQIEGVRRVVRGLEYGEGLPTKMTAGAFAGVEREQEAQIRGVRLEDREASEIVSGISRDDAQPGVEEVVRLLEQAPVVDRHRLLRFGRVVLERPRIL